MTETETFIFGPFSLSVARREVRCRGDLVQLGSRAFDLLLALVTRQGQLATKHELIAAVWPDTVVDENNLTVQISALRKVLGEEGETSRYLLTIPGRGYRFVAQVERGSSDGGPDGSSPTQTGAATLPLPNKPSIAVLPFTNMSGELEQDYFADGIVEEIITALARFPALFVIARNSTFTYKGREVDIKQVGRDLGVRYVLEGSVRKDRNRVRVTGQLVQSDTGAHVWAQRYEGGLDDIFALQDEMTASIVGALVPSLQRAEIDRARSMPPGNLDAYVLYLRALAAFYTWTRVGNDQALQLLEQAMTLDPNYAAAAILAENCWVNRFTQGWSPVPEAITQSTRYARLAVQLDPDNADALAILARRTSAINQDYEEAMSLAERAVAINPNSAYAWRNGGFAFAFSGQAERALTYFERALRLNPRDPRAHDTWIGMALALIQLERDAEAIAAARKAIQHHPTFAGAWRMLAASLALAGRRDEASAALRRVLELDPTCSLATMYLRFGHSERARARFYDGLRKAGMPE
jgi:TolB-like protein/Tfp pilus assembly protein PilF